MKSLLSASLIVVALCLLASLGGSEAECCTTMAHLEFTISNGNCGTVNAKRTAHGCQVTVCGDGTPVEGTFCGKGPCNFFGCNCEGGCRHGNFGRSFLTRNQGLGISLMSSDIVNQGPQSGMWGSVSNAVVNLINKF